MKSKIENLIQVSFLNIEEKEVSVKLPQDYYQFRNQILQPEYNLGIEVTDDNPFDGEIFGEILYDLVDIDIENFIVEESTNLFYLNAYLEIIKSKNLSLPEEELVITTDKLKEMIADLLELEKEELNLRRIYKAFDGGEAEKEQKLEEEMIVKRKREEDDITLHEGARLAEVDDIVAYREADGKPIFSIKKMKRIAREGIPKNRNKK